MDTRVKSPPSDILSLLEESLRLISRLLSYLSYTTAMELARDKDFKETCRHKPLPDPLGLDQKEKLRHILKKL